MKTLTSAFVLCCTYSFCGLTEDKNFELDSFKDVQMVFDNIGGIISEFRWRIMYLEQENVNLHHEIQKLKEDLKAKENISILL